MMILLMIKYIDARYSENVGENMPIIVIVMVIVIVLGYYKNNSKKSIEKNKVIISESFGKKTSNQSFDRDLIQNDWINLSTKLSDQKQIDDITWNDLEMDQIYCLINNCKSFAGDQILYSILHVLNNQAFDVDFKKKVEFFEAEKEARNEIWYIISSMGKSKDSYYLPVFIENLESFKIPHIEYYRFMRALLFFSLIPSVFYMNLNYIILPFLVALVNIVIYALQKNRYESYLNMLGGILKTLCAAKQIMNSPSTKYEQHFHDLKSKVEIFRRLYMKIGKLQHRTLSNLSGDVLTLIESSTFGVTLWDLIQYDKVIDELIGRQKDLKALYRLMGELDAAISVASFRKTLPMYCIPTFNEGDLIEAEEIFHPLVNNPVCNTIKLCRGCIITGSNASGKSTFIKALAINVILGQSINTCMAKKIIMPACSVVTSMAVRDEVLSGESYYIKEIKYLKRIINALNNKKLVFCVVDEILRGTNTEERIAASTAILKYLNKKNCITVVATHDIELTKVLGKQYANFHFKELIRKKEIYFEYKLYPGPAISRNAIKLLEVMGFPKEITDEAGAIASNENSIHSRAYL